MVLKSSQPNNSPCQNVILLVLLALLYAGLGCSGGGQDALVPNIPPIADAGTDRVINQGQEVILNGAGSTDSDGQIVSYLWKQIAGAPVSLIGANLVAARFLAPVTGVREDLVFQLTVQDNIGASSSALVTLTANVPPTADAGPDQFVYASRPVTLTGTAEEDVDGFIIATLWEQTGGTEVALSGHTTPSINFNAPSTTETLTFRYTVTDNDGAKHSDSVNVYLSRIVFSDSFDNTSSLNNWVLENETGNVAEWNVIGGELVQLRNVNGFRESYHLGTFAYLNNSAFSGRNAFRFSVDVTPQTNANGQLDGNDVGIMFPYDVNTGTYYRFTMNSRYGFTRLEKWDGSLFSTLAVNAIGYVDGQTMTVTVEVNKDTFIVLIDDEPLFAATEKNPIASGTVALYSQDQVSFDNVIISDNSPQPMIALAAPLAYSIALTPRDANMLVAEAVVINKPIGSSVTFSLNGAAEIPSDGESGNLFFVNFDGVSNGEHEVAAILRDATGNELSRATNTRVGVGGNYIIALGDSITNGTGDKDPTNNSSIDGRIVATQGFAASLSDAWSNTTGLPQIVFNEGIPGDRSLQLDQRIDSILERHPGADTILLLIGTNDALGNVSDNAYRINLTNIADFAGTVADRFFIARLLPLYTNNGILDDRNSRIIAYNNIISQIVSQRVNVLPGPDLYERFIDQYNNLYDPDGIHPNDAGYQEIARRWNFTFWSTP